MNNSKGFTLIELVMVIVILGILAAVAIPRFSNLSSSARISSFSAASGALKGSITTFLADSSAYPEDAAELVGSGAFESSDFTLTTTEATATTGRSNITGLSDDLSDVANENIWIYDDEYYVGVSYTNNTITDPF